MKLSKPMLDLMRKVKRDGACPTSVSPLRCAALVELKLAKRRPQKWGDVDIPGAWEITLTKEGAQRLYDEQPPTKIYIFVGECRSLTAIRKGWSWEDGRLAAKPLFEALEAMGIDPAQQHFINLFTIGQEDVWELAEGEKECDRRDRASYRSRSSDYRPERYRPYGNPGPGLVAEVVSMGRNGDCTFEWKRKRSTYSHRDSELLTSRIKVPRAKLFNVDAYTPGDYRMFFKDPRTRAAYLQWAPFLLTAEDWHAGKRPKAENEEE